MGNSTSTENAFGRVVRRRAARWLLLVAGWAVLCVLACSASVAQTRAIAPADEAARILRRALESENRLVFSGEQTVLTFTEGDGAVCVTEEAHTGPSRYRIIYKNPPSARGRVQIADGYWRRLYLPQTHTVVKNRLNVRTETSARLTARLARIQKHYWLRLLPGTDTSTGRPAHRLELQPRLKDRPAQRLWIDDATGLILRRESYRANSPPMSVSYWRNLRFYDRPAQISLGWTPPRDTQLHSQYSEQEIYQLAAARKMAGAWAILPADLGKGFQFESARRVDVKGSRGVYSQYSDGLNTISLLQVAGPETLASEGGENASARPARVGKQKAQIAERGTFTVLSWAKSSPVVTMSLVGEIAERTLIHIAESLR